MGKHSEWRKLAKKARRKRIRQTFAQKRDEAEEEEQKRRALSPSYICWSEEQGHIEEFQKQEEARLAEFQEKEWHRREKEAGKQWLELQRKLELAREERIKQNERIKQEWEIEQKRLKELRDLKREKEEKEKRKQEELLQQIDDFIEHGGETPEQLKATLETNPNKAICPFFRKTGACRFNDTCSRNHVRPGISRIVLIPNFYSHYSLEHVETEHGNDNMLEFESHEIYSNFKEFFYDVVPEMEKCGHIWQFKVCCNAEPHLRGNVYVEYASSRDAIKSYKVFQGRWYGGKQLNVEFCSIESWNNAICGQFYKKTCPKGSACNFLHVFRNPNNSYHTHTQRSSYRKSSQKEHENFGTPSEHSARNWRWSESPERIIPLENGSNASSKRNSTTFEESSRKHSRHRKRSHSGSKRERSSSERKKRSSRRRRSRSSSRKHRSSRIIAESDDF